MFHLMVPLLPLNRNGRRVLQLGTLLKGHGSYTSIPLTEIEKQKAPDDLGAFLQFTFLQLEIVTQVFP